MFVRMEFGLWLALTGANRTFVGSVIEMISIQSLGLGLYPNSITDIAAMPKLSFEGPAYADRVGGKLTFRDWDHWNEEDRIKWFAERIRRQPLKED